MFFEPMKREALRIAIRDYGNLLSIYSRKSTRIAEPVKGFAIDATRKVSKAQITLLRAE